MNLLQIEENIIELSQNITEEFIFDFLLSYGIPKATITLMKKGKGNLSKNEHQVILKKKIFFHELNKGEDSHVTIEDLQNDKISHKHSPRFIIVTDYKSLLAIDTKTLGSLECELSKLWKYYDFFLPLAGREKSEAKNESIADVKAAYKLAKLYDSIREENVIKTPEELHALNKFLSRLLFCYFAEDTGVFPKDIFTLSLERFTENNGKDISAFLQRLFDVLDTKKENRRNLPEYLDKFPYVNGKLFTEKFQVPKFTAKSRKILIEAGKLLNWADINPDIFGSMVQAVVHPDQRENMGMHYTSVPNIMKVIQPLFLDELIEEYEEKKENPKKLQELLKRLSNIRIFDPACGSGNFLIIAYKELRKLEIKVLKALYDDNILTFPVSHIQLSQFYGIEIDDFACEVAELSLYIANHQMNLEFTDIFEKGETILPLKSSGNIVQGNATRTNWEDVCQKERDAEIYIVGNPPFDGARKQTPEQKEDLKRIFKVKYGNLDYVSAWYFKGAQYIKWTQHKIALVSTNSVCQGEQVSLLWPLVFDFGVDISFAYTSFKWKNNAKHNAGVIVVIVGLSFQTTKQRYIFSDNNRIEVKNISPYLTEGSNLSIKTSKKSISNFPDMNTGSMPNDGGNLIFSSDEKQIIVNEDPNTSFYFKKLIGAKEFLRGETRWCLWLDKKDLGKACENKVIESRVKRVEVFRGSSKRDATKKLSGIPHRFGEVRYQEKDSIIIPRHSSERRKYIPIGFISKNEVIMDSALCIYTDENYVFGIITSNMHMVWVKAVAGRIKSDFRYSNDVVYNTFPFPNISTKKKQLITEHVHNILDEREKHSEKTLADLYDPDKMPQGLKQAHEFLDEVIERCYRATPFKNDEERLTYLFKMYEQMIAEEKNNS